MNCVSLACKNMKKSFQDYVIYFLTLIFGVAIFYVFNSINDQSVVQSLSESSKEMIQLMVILLEALSIVVAFVLGFLIIYANSFLIRRRKKEFGIYLLLGMGKREVSMILVAETFLVGLLSLAAGIGIGVFVSQLMSVVVGKLFEADMSAYAFTVSGGAIVKTVINFAVMYVVVLLFHARTISKLKLIELLSAAKKTEKQVLRNPMVAAVVFVICAAVLGCAYYRVGFCGQQMHRTELLTMIVAGIVATLLLFWSIAGFLLALLQRIKTFYYKDLNVFVVRQFCNSVNSSAVSMGIICLMLFATICTFAAGFSVAHEFQENMRSLTPVDFSIVYKSQESISTCLEREGMPVEQWAKEYQELPVYQTESITMATGLGDILDKAKEQFPLAKWNTPDNIMRLSDYNALATIYSLPAYELSGDEYMVVCDFFMLEELRSRNLAEGGTQQLGTVTLKPAMSECVNGYLCMSGSSANLGFVVVPDVVIDNAPEAVRRCGYILAGNYLAEDKVSKKEIDSRLHEVTAQYTAWQYMSENPVPPMTIGTKIAIRESNNGITMIAAFVVIYMGVVFLLASAALLALKALTEVMDGADKFKVLKKIGCEESMLQKCLFAQISVYFLLPLGIAVLHSVFGLRFIQGAMENFVQKGIGWGTGVTIVVLLVLYGGYMLTTYKSSKRVAELD